jgi:hypothetical protein
MNDLVATSPVSTGASGHIKYLSPEARCAASILIAEALRSGFTVDAVDDNPGDVGGMVKAEDTNPLVTIDSVQESVIWLSKRCSDGKTRRYWVHFIAENGFDALSDHNAPDLALATRSLRHLHCLQRRCMPHHGSRITSLACPPDMVADGVYVQLYPEGDEVHGLTLLP